MVKHVVIGWRSKKIISGGSVQVGLEVCKSVLQCTCVMDSNLNTGYESLGSFHIGRKDLTKEAGSKFMWIHVSVTSSLLLIVPTIISSADFVILYPKQQHGLWYRWYLRMINEATIFCEKYKLYLSQSRSSNCNSPQTPRIWQSL